jgi:hypothetical protein
VTVAPLIDTSVTAGIVTGRLPIRDMATSLGFTVEALSKLRRACLQPGSDSLFLFACDFPKLDRRSKIYEIRATNKNELNLLNVESDRLEVRLLVRYANGAYRRRYELTASDPLPNSWKESPWVKKVSIEYVAPTLVLSQE